MHYWFTFDTYCLLGVGGSRGTYCVGVGGSRARVWCCFPYRSPPPVVSSQVQEAAAVAGSAVYRTVGNRDIDHLLDDLLHCVMRPEDVSDVVTKLSATTFVQVCGC